MFLQYTKCVQDHNKILISTITFFKTRKHFVTVLQLKVSHDDADVNRVMQS